MQELSVLAGLSDRQLVASLKRAVLNERESCVEVIVHLIEFDRRRLHAPEGYPSLFHYCTRELGYAEEAAYKRIRAARAASKFPRVLRMLREGRIHLGAVVALHAHLTQENHRELLNKACGLSARELEFLVAGLAPRPDKADWVRRSGPVAAAMPAFPPAAAPAAPIEPGAPQGQGQGAAAVPAERPISAAVAGTLPPTSSAIGPRRRDAIEALSMDRVRIAFTASRAVLDRLERARALLRHRYPDGRLEGVFSDALESLLRRIDPAVRFEARERRRSAGSGRSAADASRRVRQRLRDAVWRRDGDRCTFLGPGETRCEARSGLEIDHIRPWSLGGRSDDPENLRLLCRAHNLLLARQAFGEPAERCRQRRADLKQ